MCVYDLSKIFLLLTLYHNFLQRCSDSIGSIRMLTSHTGHPLHTSSKHPQADMGWVELESLNEWGQFLKLALPGMIMLCLEWWSAEVTTFIAGTISEEELAANSVWFQTMVIFYMVKIIIMAQSLL